MSIKLKTLLDIDSPTRQQIHRSLDHHRKQQRIKNTYQGVLTLPKNFTMDCEGCGKNHYKDNMVIYCEQLFCKWCVEQWTKLKLT